MNFQKELEKQLENLPKDKKLKLLLHSCCAPCSSYVLEYLTQFFEISIFYYNPNIYPEKEFLIRKEEQKEFIKTYKLSSKVEFIDSVYNSQEFLSWAIEFKDEEEGSIRCFKCYEQRMRKTAQKAKELGFDFFTTALSISPHKNALKINEIGLSLQNEFEVNFLMGDFKKKNGFKRSVQISNDLNLYRQDYCGCIFSKNKSKIEKNKEDTTRLNMQ